MRRLTDADMWNELHCAKISIERKRRSRTNSHVFKNPARTWLWHLRVRGSPAIGLIAPLSKLERYMIPHSRHQRPKANCRRSAPGRRTYSLPTDPRQHLHRITGTRSPTQRRRPASLPWPHPSNHRGCHQTPPAPQGHTQTPLDLTEDTGPHRGPQPHREGPRTPTPCCTQ